MATTRFAVISALALTAMATAQPVVAQTSGRWQVRTLTNGSMVATSGGGMSFLCAGEAPVLALNLQPPARRSPAAATVIIDGQPRSFVITRDLSAGVWVAPLAGSGLLEAAVQGTAADITVDGTMRGRISLEGSAAAIKQALAGCWRAPGVTAAQATPAPLPAAQAQDRFFGIPMRLGYYVGAGETCAKASSVMRFERDRYFEIYDEGRTEFTIAKVTGPERDGWYSLDWRTVDGEPVEQAVEGEEGATVGGVSLRPLGVGRIEVLMQDNAIFRHCPAQEISSRLRR